MKENQWTKRRSKSSSAARRKRNLKILKNKTVLLGVSGGVAAYKSVDLVRRLKDEGASVVVVMTDASSHFITPLSLEVASGNRVYSSLFDVPLAHIGLPSHADAMVVAPATANIIAKFSHGIADDLLSTCFLSFTEKVVIAPSMNWRMYENPVTRNNLNALEARGIIQVGPEKGTLACGEEGAGRMAEPHDIVATVKSALSPKDLSGEKIVVTAGPTREYLDPVRFISNRSSGKMGFALAKAARDRGAKVTLISGPVSLQRPFGMDFLQVETSDEMLNAVRNTVEDGATVLIMAAAVADYSPVTKAGNKLEKTSEMSLKLRKADDIIMAISHGNDIPFIIGFAAETGNNPARAAEKREKKRMDMIVFNDVTDPDAGFDVDTNRVIIIDKKGETKTDLMDKEDIAWIILDRLRSLKT